MDIVTYALCKKYTDEEIQHITELGPFHYAGSVEDYEHLPVTADKGTVYTTSDTGDEYVWDGSAWLELGPRKYTAGYGIAISSDNVISLSTGSLDWLQVRQYVDAGLAPDIYPVGHKFIVGHSRYGDRKVTVVGHDQIASAIGKTHTMTLLWDECLEDVQFDAPEAFAYCPNGLAVGTYHMSVTGRGATPTGTYQFTIPSAVPAGGQLCVSGNVFSIAITSLKVIAYAEVGGTTEVWSSADRPAISSGGGGTNLGAWDSGLNHIQRIAYGSDNYGQSAIRQFLNSDAAAGSVWAPTNNFDRPPSWASSTAGFLNGLDPNFLSIVDTAKVKCSTNNEYESPDSEWAKNTAYTLNDKIFLASKMEVFGSSEVVDGSVLMTYFVGATNDDRIKLLNGSPKPWWSRTPLSGNATSDRNVNIDGSLDSSYAYNSFGCVPACII